MNYPLISEYVEAIKLAEDNLEQLSFLRPVLDSDGRPVMSSGNFAVVFKMKDERDGKFYALKCFIKDQNGRNEAYKQIADELEFVSSEFIIPIKFYEKELFVNTSNGDETEFPVLLMDWVEGVTLDKYVRNHLHDQYSLQLISYQFCRVAAWLMAQPFAHGDLKPDNILVKDDVSLVLVDYDGMFVPAMKGQKAREVGSPDYRHPARTIDDFNESIDDFSMATIAMQLYAIALCPGMLTATAGDTLLLGEKDYLDLENSEVMTKLFSQVGNPEFEKLLAIFLLAHSEMSLSKLSFRIFNIRKPIKPDVPILLSTEVTEDEITNGVMDEFGAIYSKNWRRLLKGTDIQSYRIPSGTQVICSDAFLLCDNLISIYLSDSVTTIGKYAFSLCGNLTSISIPESVIHIEDKAFSGCSKLESINVNMYNKVYDSRENCNAIIHTASNTLVVGCKNTIITDSVTHIGYSAFYSCNRLTSICIPDSVIHIEDNAFQYCTRLRSISIPNSITFIGNGVFDGCENLTSIIIPNGSMQRFQVLLSDYCDKLIEKDEWNRSFSTEVTEEDIWDGIKDESGATYSNDWNRLLHVPENISSLVIKQGTRVIGDRAFSLFMGREDITSNIIPNTVTHIGQDAFSGCRRLTSILIPNSVTDIHNRAFSWCARLNSITIPKSVTFIGTGVFNACSELKSIKVDDDNQVYDSRGNCNAVIHTKTNTLIAGCSTTQIPNSISRIGDQAFWTCHGLKSIVIPNSVTSIDNEAFYECDGLTDISIPDSVKYIGSFAFEGCKGLSSIFIPDSLTLIENDAYYGCGGLRSIVVSKNNPIYDSRDNCNAIIDTHTNTLLLGCVNTNIPHNITYIGNNAFYGFDNLTSITIPDSVKSIGDGAFQGCSGITSIALPESVSHIGNEAFQFCIKIKSLFIPECVIHIGHNAFLGCDGLISIKVSKNNPIYDSRDNCNAIIHTKTNTLITGCSNTTIPDSITQIGDFALCGNDGLTNISIPCSVTYIGDCAFAECSNLTDITIPNSVTHIGDGAFADCDSLMSITIPKGSTNRFKQLITNESIHKLLVEK